MQLCPGPRLQVRKKNRRRRNERVRGKRAGSLESRWKCGVPPFTLIYTWYTWAHRVPYCLSFWSLLLRKGPKGNNREGFLWWPGTQMKRTSLCSASPGFDLLLWVLHFSLTLVSVLSLTHFSRVSCINLNYKGKRFVNHNTFVFWRNETLTLKISQTSVHHTWNTDSK